MAIASRTPPKEPKLIALTLTEDEAVVLTALLGPNTRFDNALIIKQAEKTEPLRTIRALQANKEDVGWHIYSALDSVIYPV